MAIHGNKSQNARVKALQDFKDNKITALVATEVAARGLDIKELPHVVNYELPNVPEDYVHRIGRTARAGSTGAAISLVSPDELSYLRDIEKLLKQKIDFVEAPKFEIKEGTHVSRSGEQGEYQPHQDPRRRPEHRRSGGGGQRGGRGHSSRAAPGRASHDAYAPDNGAAHAHSTSESRPGENTQAPHSPSGHSNGNGHSRPRRDGAGRGGQHQGQSRDGQRRGGQSPGQGSGHGQGQKRSGGGGAGGRGGPRGGSGSRGGFARGARSAGGGGSRGPGNNGGGGSSGGFSRIG
jgi:ATP-dependent RNA helicase RhlE